MLISVITVCYNSDKTLRDTIESVVNQTYAEIEYIIIDGASTDKTLEIAGEYSDRITKIVSEPDNGIYDAMNKGLSLAKGDVIGILNSDDFYADKNVLKDVMEQFSTNDVDCVYGDLVYVDPKKTNKILRYWKSSPYKPKAFLDGWHPPHPSFFVRRIIYENFGYFDANIELTSDFDMMLRILEIHKSSSRYVPRLCVCMRTGGATSGSIKNIAIGNKNIIRSFRKHGIHINPFIYVIKRIFPKVINKISIRIQSLISWIYK
jgi:glycosyltransferase involved in cell wall biosynthesis